MRAFEKEKQEFITFTPELQTAEPLAAYWMRQVTVRLRREVCWCRYERGVDYIDKPSQSLALQRNWEEKKKFYETDETAKYLTQQLAVPPPSHDQGPGKGEEQKQGSFAWVINQLNLDETAAFMLALGLVVVFDSAVGYVVSLCLNDPQKNHPTLSLAQKLWDRPEEILRIADPAHPLFSYGLLQPAVRENGPVINWESPVAVPTLAARHLLAPDTPLPPSLRPVKPGVVPVKPGVVPVKPGVAPVKQAVSQVKPEAPPPSPRITAAIQALNKTAGTLRIVPVMGKKDAPHRETVATAAQILGRQVVQCSDLAGIIEDNRSLKTQVTLCWLRNEDLYLGREAATLLLPAQQQTHSQPAAHWHTIAAIPVTVYISITEPRETAPIPSHLLQPGIPVPTLTYTERTHLWKQKLGTKANRLEKHIDEISRRFRFEKEAIQRITEGIETLTTPVTGKELNDACRAHIEPDMGDLAQKITPRFQKETLILPHKQHRQYQEIIKAMTSLTEVHYKWGTAEAWNESGISVLFAGAPGTGKTMGAEILAQELGLPIYRIDLSQVVNKYIGETEKNLKRLFDAADISDMILFFDEADSLFGRRTEVKDAHDRYANLEISYLLERMERFKGLAILATNRKKDLDEAFLRRLRYIIDFPFPGPMERKRIWQQVIPGNTGYSNVDIDYLAQRFQLTGGHIRSIVFNACLQCASGGLYPIDRGDANKTMHRAKGKKEKKEIKEQKAELTMEQVIVAVKREYDKMDRTVNPESFEPYYGIIEEMDQQKEEE